MADSRFGCWLKFGDGTGGLFFGQRLPMPAFFVLYEGNAGALEGLGQDNQRLFAESNCCQHFSDFFEIMSIYFFGAPAERLKASLIGVEVMAESGFLALSKPVYIHDRDEIVELVDTSQRCGFPDCAFSYFTIAKKDIRSVIKLIQSRTKSHAHTHAETLPERAGRYIHKRQPRRRMAF